MKKNTIIISFIFFILACDKKQGNIKNLDFYNKSILVSNDLIIDKKKIETNSCKDNLYLKNTEDNTFVSYELCSYRYSKRGNFKQLKSLFEEECEVIESEVSNLLWIDKSSNERKKHYVYTFTFNAAKEYHHVTCLAFEKYFVIIKIQSSNENELNELISLIKENKSLGDIDFNNKTCSRCKFPAFW